MLVRLHRIMLSRIPSTSTSQRPSCVVSRPFIERGRGSRGGEKTHFGLERFCTLCCSNPHADFTKLGNNVSAQQVLQSSHASFHLVQNFWNFFEPDGRKRVNIIKLVVQIHCHLTSKIWNRVAAAQYTKALKPKDYFSLSRKPYPYNFCLEATRRSCCDVEELGIRDSMILCILAN